MSRTFRVVDAAGAVQSYTEVTGKGEAVIKPCETDDPNGMRIAARWARRCCQTSPDKDARFYVVSDTPLENGESKWEVEASGSFRPVGGSLPPAPSPPEPAPA